MPTPPQPAVRITHVASPHGTREDPYFWLRDDARSNPEVLTYLAAENAYAEAVLKPHERLMEQVFEEIVGRLKQDDSTVPVRFRGYWYASRFQTGREYPVIVRWPDAPGATETVLLDCNELAAGEAFFQLGGYAISLDNRLLAYTQDTVGRRQYRVRVKDIASGRLLDDVVDNAEGDVVWAADHRTFLYVEKDPVTLLGRRIRRHVLGTPAVQDAIVYEEPDETFDLEISASKSERYLFIASESTTSSEWRYARADDPLLQFRVFAPREADHEYQLEHLGERFYVRTNWQAENFRIAAVEVGAETERARWSEVVAHQHDVFVDDFEVFRDFIAVSERSGGLRKIRVQRWGGAAQHLEAADPTYTMRLGINPDPQSTKLRYTYTSLTTPATVFEYDIYNGVLAMLKREPVLGDFDPAHYASEFLWVPARDGERVPVSIVYRKSIARDGTAPLYLYAYGAYGLCSDPAFSSSLLSLLDRGFVYAIAHVRGGQELGRRWYEAGRRLHKRNTFTDFIDVTDYLVEHRYGARDRVFAAGGSAGGLLVGAVMNMAPQKYAGVVAHVPFVDIVTTMLDETIPLTTLEYDEWGDPRRKEDYDYMLSYSPYDNVRARAYPPMLVTTGLWDSQVQYFEPAKWVAKLRATKADRHPVLLHVNLDAGHGGKTGRFEHLREVAREYAFVIAVTEGGLGAWDTGHGQTRAADASASGARPQPRVASSV